LNIDDKINLLLIDKHKHDILLILFDLKFRYSW